MGLSRTTRIALALGLAAGFTAAPARGQSPVQPYQTNDGGGFRNILPPGSNGLDNATQAAAFLTSGTRPANSDDQRDMYANLVYAAPNLKPGDIGQYYKDASFGVKPEDVVRTYSPSGRTDVTIVRDKFGVPHIYGSTRDGTMFGIGYA